MQPNLEKKVETILERGVSSEVSQLLNEEMQPVDVARLIESSQPHQRQLFWGLISEENTGQILNHLDDEVSAEFLSDIRAEELVNSLSDLSDDDVTDLLQQMPNLVMEQVLKSMHSDERERVEQLLDYPEGTVGAIMSTEFLTVRPYIFVDVVLRYLRRVDKLTLSTGGKLAVVDNNNKFIGVLSLTALVQSQSTQRVSDLMDTEVETLSPDDDDKHAIEVFERYDMISVPVIAKDKKFLGMVTVDDVFDLVLEQRDRAVTSGAGISADEDTFAPLTKVANRRVFWLGINLVTVLLASFFIGIFQETLDKIVALAILMPIVASMGGIIGIQSMTIMIRAQTLGRINYSNALWLIRREVGIGLFNGIIWSAIMGGISYLWFQDHIVSLSLGLAMIINLIIGSTLGVFLPLILEKLKIDPVNAGGVLLTTFTDIVGFIAFLGIASILYIGLS